MRIVIVDDKVMNINLLVDMLEGLDEELDIVGTATHLDEAVKLVDKVKPELIFLDIDMGEGYGFDVITRCEFSDFEVIFVTAFPSYALKSFEYSPLHFLTKPVDIEELEEGLRRFKHRRSSETPPSKREQKHKQYRSQKPKRICLPDREQLKIVPIDEIVFCEASNIYTVFHFKDRSELVVTRPLNTYEKLLDEDGFCRIHESYLINLHYVDSYRKGRGGEVHLAGDKILPVAARRKEVFMRKLNKIAHG